jgi:hypothetical protein
MCQPQKVKRLRLFSPRFGLQLSQRTKLHDLGFLDSHLKSEFGKPTLQFRSKTFRLALTLKANHEIISKTDETRLAFARPGKHSRKPQSKGQTVTFTWTTTDADSCAIDQGIGTVPVTGGIEASPASTATYTLTATGFGGSTSRTVTVYVNDPATPLAVSLSTGSTAVSSGDPVTLSWTTAGAASVFIDNGIGLVPATGSMRLTPPHTTTFTLTATGSEGARSASATVRVLGHPASLPEGSFGKQYEDLTPDDATLAAYDARRFSIITGGIADSAGLPVAGATISVLDHAEYGTATSDASGRFSLPVEGGDTLTVVYEKPGFLTIHRQVYVPWNDFAVAPEVTVTAEDPARTAIAFDGNPDTILRHRSSMVTDADGSRALTMVFSGDNLAYLQDDAGHDLMPLASITTRATEYSTPAAMPAELPPTSAFTYCVELSVEGASKVRFAKPVLVYVDNFLGFAVGEVVPAGTYDRGKGVWLPLENGTVVQLLDTDGDGVTDALDQTGDGQADDFDGDGLVTGEAAGLEDPLLYAPGATFWRVALNISRPRISTGR